MAAVVAAGASGDPFPAIKAVVERELEHLGVLEAELFSGRSEAAGELAAALSGLEEQLGALEEAAAAMVANPERYGMSRGTAFHRQVEVENLRFQLGDIKRSVETVRATSSRPAYTEIELGAQPSARAAGSQRHPGAPARGTAMGGGRGGAQKPGSGGDDGGGGGLDAELSAHQDQVHIMIRQQDDALDEMSMRLGHIKRAGELMHEELAEQEALLGELQDATDTSNLKLRGLRRRVTDIIQRSRSDRQLVLVLLLSAVLVVLTFFAFA